MPLTREQVLAAGFLVLAMDAMPAAPPPGGTIAQGAAAAAGGGLAHGKGSGGPKKVATAPGSAFYHKPIGALIIPHGHPHFVKGAPSHMVKGDISEAKWIANQWKGTTHEQAHEQAKAAAEKAVAEGTHHWVQAGEHSYAVHNGLEVHVPKDTDIHDEAAVKNAPKVIVKHGEHPEHLTLHPDHPNEPQPHDAGAEHLLATGYKKLPEEKPKKAVHVNGKHAAWVPHDWQVYKAVDAPESALTGKWAKDPEGTWHFIGKAGEEPTKAHGAEGWVKSGQLVPDEAHPGPEPGHVAPNQGAEGAEPVKANIGGVAVTKEEIQDALAKLQGSSSTQIKGLLKGHPLAAADYHAAFKGELEKFPELKVPSGTKKAHVPEAKNAFIHHLAGALDQIAGSEAEQAATAKAAQAAKAAAEHAQQLTPETLDIGGVTASKEAIQDAIDALNASKSTAIKQVLKAKGSPLAGVDYWQVIHDYQAAHPAELQHGTKQAHAPNAKTAFIAALEEKAGLAAGADTGSGHDVAAQIDAALSGGTSAVKPGWNYSVDGAIAMALAKAADINSEYYASLSPIPGEWMIGFYGPEDKAYMEATPDHKVILHLTTGEAHEWTQQQVADVVQGWVKAPEPKVGKPTDYEDFGAWKAAKDAEEAAAELEKAKAQAEALKAADEAAKLKPAWDTGAWKQTPGYQAVHDLIVNHPPGLPPHDNPLDTDQQLASAMYLAAKTATKYLTPGLDGGWQIHGKVPFGVAGTFGIPGKAYYELSPDHEITAYGTDGQPVALPGEQIKQIAEKWLTPKQPEPAPDIPVWYQGNQEGTVPAGSKFYEDIKGPETGFFYVKLPDGTWKGYNKYGINDAAVNAPHWDKLLTEGEFHEIPPPDINTIPPKAAEPEPVKPYPFPPVTAAPEPAQPEPAAPEPTPAELEIQQLKQLLINGAVKPSTEVADGKQNADWVLAAAMQKAAKSGNAVWAQHKDYGGWVTISYEPYLGESAEFYHVTPDLAVTHHVDGKDISILPEVAGGLAQQLVVPDSVKIMDAYSSGYKIYKHGFYYKPSKTAKAYLEIKPPGDGKTSVTFIYHAPSGDKQVNASYAAKVLQDATEYQAEAKGAGAPGKAKVSYATVAKPGTYQIWSAVTKAPSPDHSAEIFADGSALLTAPGSSAPLSAEGDPAAALLKGGSLLDQYGTSVVKPGIVPDQYHVFGGEPKTAEELQSGLNMMEQHYGDKLDITQIFKDFLPGVAAAGPVHTAAMAFFSAKLGEVDWLGQRDSFMGLLRELLQVPAQPAGSETGAPAEVKFLKGLPPGIATAHDVFAWTDTGYAKPADATWPDYGGIYLTSPELSAAIKEIGAQFGDGKVVGTHVSSLSKDQKIAWLKAWAAGDMAKVFALDASGGKVSPAHPGAPDNAATHHVTWAPWDESQVPAGQAIEGSWSPEGVMPPKAEADNYLIKAGLQHAAFLSVQQRRNWMQFHQAHDQTAVDKLSKQAADAFNSGAQPKTEPPTWTDDLGPAKAYDAYLDEKTPAQQWPAAALDAFVADHKDALGPLVTKVGQESYGYGPGLILDDLLSGAKYGAQPIKQQAVQLYLDDLAAKEAAEKLKPKYSLAEPGIAADQFGRQYQWITGTSAQLAKRSAVAALALAWGFRTPQVSLVSLEDGTAGAVAPLLKHEGTLAFLPAGIAGLTARELGDVAREHVLDYALANPGSTPGSYLRVADGSVVGADKSSALSDLSWDGASQDGMNAQVAQPVSMILAAIADGSLGQDQADAAYVAAIRAARRMSSLSNSRMEQALASAGLDEHSISQLTDRKNALPDTIRALYDGVYAQQGWTPPEVPVAKISRGLHAGFSEPEFLDHVLAAKSFGVPAFFAEPGLADGHVLVWTELAPGGQRLIRGEASIRKLASDKVTGWVKAHSGDAASMVPQGEVGFNLAIQHAALYIDKHNMVMKNYDYTGPETSAAMAEMAAAKSQLTSQLASAQHALAVGPASADYAAVAKAYGDPASVVSMAQHYLAQIDTAEQAKAAGVGTPLSPDQFPGWKAAEQSHLGGGVKITYKKATRQLGTDAADVTADTWSLGKEDGELHLAAGKSADYPGYVWQVELPTGEVIEINDAAETQTPKAHHGMIRFTSVTGDGAASLERVRAFLQQAGLGMEEAGQADMENQYWRTMAWVLSDRADRKDAKHMAVWDELAQGLYGKNAFDVIGYGKEITHLGDLPGQVIQKHMAPEAEAALWRTAWAHLTSPEQVQQWVDNEGYLPHLAHHDIHSPEVPGGKPDWYRFDVTPDQVAAQQMLTESLYDPGKDAALVVRSGGLFSSDARLRALGTYKTGMSWGSDMSHGASGMVFTRQNQQSETHMSVWISPRVLARAQTYSFPSDHYGEIDDRRTAAYFDFAKASAMSQSGNETLILDGISLLDDIEVIKAYSETQRQQIVADLKVAGVTEIRGLAVEDRIVTSSGVAAAVSKAAAAMKKAAAGWFGFGTGEWDGGPAAPATVMKKVAGAVKSLVELLHSVGVAWDVSAEHGGAAAAGKVNQVFYKMAGVDPQAGSMAVRGKIKGEVAKRIAGVMTSSDQAIQQMFDAAGLYAPANWGPTPRIRAVAAILGSWAVGSDSPVIIALQRRAQQVFGITREPFLPDVSASTEAQVAELESGFTAVLDDLLAAMWQQTQQDVADGGVDSITLYRVFKFSGEPPAWAKDLQPGQVIDAAPSYPFSSWSLSPGEIAKDIVWGHGKPVLVKATVPRELLLAYPRSGLGSYLQGEFVVLDSAGQWEVVE